MGDCQARFCERLGLKCPCLLDPVGCLGRPLQIASIFKPENHLYFELYKGKLYFLKPFLETLRNHSL
jgi:hypothetical protein